VAVASPQVVRKAYADFMRKISDQQEESKMTIWLKPQFRAVGIATLIIVALILFLSFPSGKSWAGQFLGIFRVQQVKFVELETNVLEEISGNSTLNQRLGEIISSSITVLREPEEPQEVADAQTASQLVGYPIRLPTKAAATPSIVVNGGTAFEMVIDRERVQAFLEEVGRGDLVLPQSLNGAVVNVDIPRGVSALYGECPSVKKSDDEQSPEEKRRVNYPNCIIFSIFASPTVTTPPDLDLAQLVQLGLEFSGGQLKMPNHSTQQIDWTSTLVIPIPKRDAHLEQLSVDGVIGSLILQETGYIPRYALIWTKDGIVYACMAGELIQVRRLTWQTAYPKDKYILYG
jgi:hypothetical protein